MHLINNNIQTDVYIKMTSPEGKKRNCITSKENFVNKKKKTESILKKISCFEFLKSIAYTFLTNY